MAPLEDRRRVTGRLSVLQYVVAVLFSVLAVGFWVLQVVQHAKFEELAENNNQRTLALRAPRGIVFDRDGHVLVENRHSYSISIVREHTKDINRTIRLLAEVLGPYIKIVNAIPRIVLGSIFVVAFGIGKLIFKELGIPTYVIWDCDGDKKGGSPEQNLGLIRVLDPTADHKVPPTETAVTATYAHFADTLEGTLKAELTEAVFHAALTSACGHFETNVGRDAQKSPEVMKRLLLDANEAGHTSATLENIIRTIWLTLKGVTLP